MTKLVLAKKSTSLVLFIDAVQQVVVLRRACAVGGEKALCILTATFLLTLRNPRCEASKERVVAAI